MSNNFDTHVLCDTLDTAAITQYIGFGRTAGTAVATGPWIGTMSADPSAGAGIAANLGSIILRRDAGNVMTYMKTTAPDTGWIQLGTLAGPVTLTAIDSTATDDFPWELFDNSGGAFSFNTAAQDDIFNIITTNGAEGTSTGDGVAAIFHRMTDIAELQFGDAGTDLVMAADGADVAISGTGNLVAAVDYIVNDTLTVAFGTAGAGLIMTGDAATGATLTGAGGIVAAVPYTVNDASTINFGTGGADLTMTADTAGMTVDGTGPLIIDGAAVNLRLNDNRVIEFGDGGADYLFTADTTGVTATGTGPLTVQTPITTTNGIAAGTAKVVGGRSYASVADSTVVTAIAAPTATDTTFVIPADTFLAGSMLKIVAICRSIAVNAADTIQYSLRMEDGGGAEVLVASTAANVGANNRVRLEGTTVFRAAPGAAVGSSSAYVSHDNSVAAYTMGPAAGAVVAYNTAAAITIDVLVTHSANNAGNQSVLESLYVEVI